MVYKACIFKKHKDRVEEIAYDIYSGNIDFAKIVRIVQDIMSDFGYEVASYIIVKKLNILPLKKINIKYQTIANMIYDILFDILVYCDRLFIKDINYKCKKDLILYLCSLGWKKSRIAYSCGIDYSYVKQIVIRNKDINS